MTAPEANSTLGDIDITRETGLSPAGLMVGDRIDLLGSELMHLSVTATSTGTVVRTDTRFLSHIGMGLLVEMDKPKVQSSTKES